VLLVVIDPADRRIVGDLLDAGELPVLAKLRAAGGWSEVVSTNDVGSESVAPTFLTCSTPDCHGEFSGWPWSPERMGVVPVSVEHLHPFWADLARANVTVGVLDVPSAPHVGLRRGFEVTEWGPHYLVGGRRVSPPDVAPLVPGGHPFLDRRLKPSTQDHLVDTAALMDACLASTQLRGDLTLTLLERTQPDVAVITFTEIHRASHDLWHTAEPDHPLFAALPASRQRDPSVFDVYRATDTQIGRLIEAVGDTTPVAVVSLHGMCPALGIASVLLQPVLDALGYSAPASQDRVTRRLLAGLKAHTPSSVKNLYNNHVPRAARHRLAAPTLIPALDWSATRAFALPSDQHGWLRVNLRGREAAGCVAPEDYDRLCAELRAVLEPLATVDGRPLVSRVIAGTPDATPHRLLPDLIVHWTDAAFDHPVRVAAPAVEVVPTVRSRTGQHTNEGFVLARGAELPPSMHASEIVPTLLAASGYN
jgi:predicted AlkP superfamily phosphohydrolase/phosphomutase